MNKVFITVDLEEWYELDYLRDFNLKSSPVEMIPKIIDFLDILDSLKIRATFFILANIAEKNADIIREIRSRGHDIGCHGFDHRLLYEKENCQFYHEIIEAKRLLEKIAMCQIIGYRASCFTMDRAKLELVRKAGFEYDSSKILFSQHPLYRNLDLNGFAIKEDLIYTDNDFTEFEIPTLKLGKYNVPISGGGYLRLFPFWLIKLLIKIYEKQHENFLIYVHPFELTNHKMPLPKGLGLLNHFRASIGRKHNQKKLKKIFEFLHYRGAEFVTLNDEHILRQYGANE